MFVFRNTYTAIFLTTLLTASPLSIVKADDQPISVKIVDQFNTMFGSHPGVRANHAKGVVFEGHFKPSAKAASLAKALHLQKKSTPITVRFSNAGGLPDAPDSHPSAKIKGIAIKFHLPDGSDTDVLGITLKGFPVSNGEDFLAFLQAAAKSGPGTAKPTPLEEFLAAHPTGAKNLSQPLPPPVSYATVPYFGINAFKFTNAKGETHYGRYRFVPVAPVAYLKDAEVEKRPPNALGDELKSRVLKAPVHFKLLVQLAQAGDEVNDATQVWPEDRPTVELGDIVITKTVPDNATAEKALLFLPTNLTSGIEASDDPLIDTRAAAYAESFSRRSQ